MRTAFSRPLLPLVFAVAGCGSAPEPAETASATEALAAEQAESVDTTGSAQDQESVPATWRGIEIAMTGRGPLLDRQAYVELMTYAGSLVTDRKIDRFVVHGRGVEGGLYFCIQLAHPAFMGDVVAGLGRIEPDSRTTYYAWSPAAECGVR